MKSIGILEDNVALRDTIMDFMATGNQYHIEFSLGSYNELLLNKTEISPDFILLDIHLNDVLGVDVIGDLKKLFPESFIIIITGDKDKAFLLKAIKNGANGYLYKPFKMTELEDVISKVDSTGSFLEPEMLTKLLSMLSERNIKTSLPGKQKMTQREEEILELIKKGNTYKEMAELLNVSFHTVNYHLKNIYIKTNVKSKNELMAMFFNENKL